MERQKTRIDAVRDFLDGMLNALPDAERRRNGFVHLYGVGQAAAQLALRRGHDREYAELSEIAGLLHDYTKYRTGEEAGHAGASCREIAPLLRDTAVFREEEIALICRAVELHSRKEETHSDFDEILKDADELQHFLRNPREDYFFYRPRAARLRRELGLSL